MLYLSRQEGRPVSNTETGQVLGQHRRFFSALFARCQAASLVTRMGHLGEGAREAAARRKVWTAQVMRSSKEAEAFHSAYSQGRGKALARPPWTLGTSSRVPTEESRAEQRRRI